MKYIHQALIIAAITFFAELLKFILPFPFPASIYGLVTLFTLLKTGILKLSDVQDVGGLLLELMPLLLVPASVSFLTCLDTIQTMLLPVLISGLAGTTLVLFVTGHVTQWCIQHRKAEKK
ncbi:MAG: CidA/LrgA family protein [Oscillospiraceae bacterium]|nr:CidA/LrgA family protein [Oscillospiraceae bacterium]